MKVSYNDLKALDMKLSSEIDMRGHMIWKEIYNLRSNGVCNARINLIEHQMINLNQKLSALCDHLGVEIVEINPHEVMTYKVVKHDKTPMMERIDNDD